MAYLKALLITIEVLSSLLLIVVILLQRSKSEGLGLAFGSQMGESLFGAQAGNVLVKITVWLGIIFLVNTTVLAKIYTHGPVRSLMSERSTPVAPAAPARPPGLPAPAGGIPPSLPVPAPAAPAAAPAAPVAPVPTPAP